MITIEGTILDGNLGEGWGDEYEAAKRFAAFCEERIATELGIERSNVTYSVQKNTSGVSPETFVSDPDLMDEVLRLEQKLWEEFCATQ